MMSQLLCLQTLDTQKRKKLKNKEQNFSTSLTICDVFERKRVG